MDSNNLFVPEEPVGELNPRCGECKGDPSSTATEIGKWIFLVNPGFSESLHFPLSCFLT